MSTVAENQSTEIIKVEEITSILGRAGDILTKNTNLVNSASKKIQGLLDTIEGGGMNAELDAELNSWQVKKRDALKIINDRRKPVTQMANQMVKAFTSLENLLEDFDKRAQAYRNSWASKQAEEKRKKEQEILNKQKAVQERIDVQAEAEKQIRAQYNEKLFSFKQHANKLFNEITLQNHEEVKQKINDIKVLYPRDKFYLLPVNVTAVYIEKVELAGLIHNKREELYDELAANFRENMEVTKQETLDKIPSKLNELREMAKASAAQKEELEKQRIEREKAEALRLQNEAEEQKKRDEQRVAEQAEVNKVSNLFDSQAQLSELQPEGKTKDGYEIIVKNYAGWMLISAFWFEREGKTLAADKFEKKTLGQMKAFAEKAALKDDKEKITSAHIEYKPIVKALVNKG